MLLPGSEVALPELALRLWLLFSWCDVVQWLDCSILHSSVCIYIADHSVKGASYQWSMLSPHCSVAPITIMRKGKLWYWDILTYSWTLLFCLLVKIGYEIDDPREREDLLNTAGAQLTQEGWLMALKSDPLLPICPRLCSWLKFWFPFGYTSI